MGRQIYINKPIQAIPKHKRKKVNPNSTHPLTHPARRETEREGIFKINHKRLY